MNFLSHYYFDRFTTDANVVMGTVLPDLVKNASKTGNFYPQKNEFLFENYPEEQQILSGWKRHLMVDLHFHSSQFFLEQTAVLKSLIKPIAQDTAVRPSFLAHIGLELLLDHLLIEHNLIQVNKFYEQLVEVEKQTLRSFLQRCGWADTRIFDLFMEKFISSKYLSSYQKIENISYALNRICMRIWPETLNEMQLQALTFQLSIFKPSLEEKFMDIFLEIEQKIR
ncbi:ACP phosphodiesterase [Pedobacter sandarakinus]|uniref:ACP phosphodiesterase n=1 Tax=Pedobacter sandarakinus TaxID=353156 RepID=UPI0022472645|nr:hypothetical protein [Pedobacter sandarakinus]MCX2575573.1 hypothetical protein [Pedobacter sandarakinus]